MGNVRKPDTSQTISQAVQFAAGTWPATYWMVNIDLRRVFNSATCQWVLNSPLVPGWQNLHSMCTPGTSQWVQTAQFTTGIRLTKPAQYMYTSYQTVRAVQFTVGTRPATYWMVNIDLCRVFSNLATSQWVQGALFTTGTRLTKSAQYMYTRYQSVSAGYSIHRWYPAAKHCIVNVCRVCSKPGTNLSVRTMSNSHL